MVCGGSWHSIARRGVDQHTQHIDTATANSQRTGNDRQR